MELQKKIWCLDDRRIALEKEIKDIENNTDENIYMLKTGKILSDYYKILEQEKQFASGIVSSSQPINQIELPESSIPSTNILDGGDNSDTTGIKRKCIIDWFSQTPTKSTVFENVDSGKKIVNITKKKNDKPNNKIKLVLNNKKVQEKKLGKFETFNYSDRCIQYNEFT